jgi:hypothetical protein
MRYLAQEDGRVARSEVVGRDHELREAARCGHPEAIRRLGEMALTEELGELRFHSIITRVAWLHQRRTRAEGDLLVALLTKGGPRSWQRAGNIMVAHFDQDIADRCPPRRPLGSHLFPGD